METQTQTQAAKGKADTGKPAPESKRQFRPLDIVLLLSGGPAMVVIDASYERPVPHCPPGWQPWAKCGWFDKNHVYQERTFSPQFLKASEVK